MRSVGTWSRMKKRGAVGMLSAALGVVASSLVVFPARTRTIMKLSVGAREYGHWLGVANLFFGIWSLSSRSALSRAIPVLNLLSGMVLLAPTVWARMLSDDLRRKSAEAFEKAAGAPEGEPVRLGRLFRPSPERAQSMKKDTLVYSE